MSSSSALLHHVDAIARHFDFLPVSDHAERAAAFPTISRSPTEETLPLTHRAPIPEHPFHRDLTHGIRALYAHGLHMRRGNHLFYTVNNDLPDASSVTFHAIDMEHTFADSLLIQVTRSLLSSLNFPHRIRLNMLGDKDAKKRFSTELGTFFMRHAEELPEHILHTAKKDVLGAYRSLLTNNDDIVYKSPVPIDCLNERSRRSLRSILEYLDLTDGVYEIDPRLMGDYAYHSGFLFTADMLDADGAQLVDTPCAVYGGRYDEYTKAHTNTARACAGVTIHFRKDMPAKTIKTVPKHPKKGIALIEIGVSPKLYGMSVMHRLLTAGISTHHAQTTLSLTDQLAFAREVGATIILILGSQETIKREVIIRNTETNKQQTVPVEKLIATLRPLIR